MLIKLLGGTLLAVSGCLAAVMLRLYHKRRIETLDGLISLILFIKGQVDCYARPIGEILSSIPKEILRDCGVTVIPESLSDVPGGARIYLDEECLRLFTSFAAEFGKSFREEQVRRCDHYIAALGERRMGYETKALAQGRAGGAICVCVSLCLLILLW